MPCHNITLGAMPRLHSPRISSLMYNTQSLKYPSLLVLYITNKKLLVCKPPIPWSYGYVQCPTYPSLSVLYIIIKKLLGSPPMSNCAFSGLCLSLLSPLPMFMCNSQHTHHFQSCKSQISNYLVLLLPCLIVHSAGCAQVPYPFHYVYMQPKTYPSLSVLYITDKKLLGSTPMSSCAFSRLRSKVSTLPMLNHT